MIERIETKINHPSVTFFFLDKDHKTFGLTLSKQTCKDKEADARFDEEEE